VAGAVIDRPFRSAAAHYHARPPYSAALRPALASRLGWDGQGRLLDIGSGPGNVALELAPAFAEVVALDPEPAMLAAGKALCAHDHVRWVEGRADEIPDLDLGRFQAVTLAQSLHRMDRDMVIQIVHDILTPNGAMLLIHHTLHGFGLTAQDDGDSRPEPPPDIPPIPHDLIGRTLERYLGFTTAGRTPPEERHEVAVRRSVFGGSERVVLPGRRDVIRTPENLIEMVLSMSFASPERFGDRLDEFRTDLVSQLRAASPRGLFSEWPGDTEVLIATKAAP
jgi:SAM-dependent methyltransferase